MSESQEVPIPQIKPQEGERTHLGMYQIVTQKKDGKITKKDVLIDANPGGIHPFKAFDVKTDEEVTLSTTRLLEVYRAFGFEPPRWIEQNSGDYHRIKGIKHRQKVRRETPIETPPEH